MATEFSELINRVLSSQTRSTVLKPLGWLIVILTSASISAYHFNSPAWLAGTFGVLAAISSITYIIAFAYFAYKDPDALRSEKFFLQKLAIQQGFYGDDLTGYKSIAKPIMPALSPPDENDEEKEDVNKEDAA